MTLNSTKIGSIYYTLNGSTPKTSSTLYSSYFSISSTTTLKAIAIDQAGNTSAVDTESYTFPTPTATSITPTNTSSSTGSKQVIQTNNDTSIFGIKETLISFWTEALILIGVIVLSIGLIFYYRKRTK